MKTLSMWVPWALLVVTGCAGSLDSLRVRVEAGDYRTAAVLAASDPQTAQALAAMLVEDELRKCKTGTCDAPSLVSDLLAAGREGRQSLRRLAADAAEPIASLGRIALERGGDPPKDWQVLASHDHGTVREAFATTFAARLSDDRLLALAVDTSPGVRRAALAALAERPPVPASIEALRTALRSDPSPLVRLTAARAGKHLGEDALLRLVAALEDESQGVALAAVEGLGRLGTPEAMDRLERLSQELPSFLSTAAQSVLCRSGRNDSCQSLLSGLADESVGRRREVLLSLVPLAGIDAVRKDLAGSAFKAVSDGLNQASTGEDPWIIDALLLLQGAALSAAQSGETRETELPTEGLREALSTLGETNPDARFEVQLLLGRSGKAGAYENAARELDPQNDEVRLCARLPQVHGAPPLWSATAALLGDERPRVRLSAARALLHMAL